MSMSAPVYGPFAIVQHPHDTLWLSSVWETADQARAQIDADVAAGIAEPHTLSVRPLVTLNFVRADHHPRRR